MDAAALAHGERGEIQNFCAENGVVIDEHVVVLQISSRGRPDMAVMFKWSTSK